MLDLAWYATARPARFSTTPTRFVLFVYTDGPEVFAQPALREETQQGRQDGEGLNGDVRRRRGGSEGKTGRTRSALHVQFTGLVQPFWPWRVKIFVVRGSDIGGRHGLTSVEAYRIKKQILSALGL
jgi:hypothetical protein